MGVRYPSHTMEDFLLKRVPRLEDIIIETGVKGIGLICGADDILGAANPTYSQEEVRILSQIRGIGRRHCPVGPGSRHLVQHPGFLQLFSGSSAF